MLQILSSFTIQKWVAFEIVHSLKKNRLVSFLDQLHAKANIKAVNRDNITANPTRIYESLNGVMVDILH